MKQLKERKLIRLREYDYSADGYYYITICCKNRKNYFGEIKNKEMILNEYGQIAKECWMAIPEHFQNAKIDEYIIMPNHIHGIIIIENAKNDENSRRCRRSATPVIEYVENNSDIIGDAEINSSQEQDRTKMYLPKIIHGIKSSVTREIRKIYNDKNFGWQKSYYVNIVRNENALNNIRRYIINNPIKWDLDKNNFR